MNVNHELGVNVNEFEEGRQQVPLPRFGPHVYPYHIDPSDAENLHNSDNNVRTGLGCGRACIRIGGDMSDEDMFAGGARAPAIAKTKMHGGNWSKGGSFSDLRAGGLRDAVGAHQHDHQVDSSRREVRSPRQQQIMLQLSRQEAALAKVKKSAAAVKMVSRLVSKAIVDRVVAASKREQELYLLTRTSTSKQSGAVEDSPPTEKENDSPPPVGSFFRFVGGQHAVTVVLVVRGDDVLETRMRKMVFVQDAGIGERPDPGLPGEEDLLGKIFLEHVAGEDVKKPSPRLNRTGDALFFRTNLLAVVDVQVRLRDLRFPPQSLQHNVYGTQSRSPRTPSHD